MVCRAIRGAITAEENSKKAIREATIELIKELTQANQLKKEDIICIFFTTTPDLNADFPAAAVREELGWDNIPMLCSHEINVPESLPKCIRALVLVEMEKSAELVPVYLKGAKILKGGEKR